MAASVYHRAHAPVEPRGRADRRHDPDLREDAPPGRLPARRRARRAPGRGDLLHRPRLPRARPAGRRIGLGDDRRRRGAGRRGGPCRPGGSLRSPLGPGPGRGRRARGGKAGRRAARRRGSRPARHHRRGHCLRGDRGGERPRRQVGRLRGAAAPLRPADRDVRREDPCRGAPDRASGRAPAGGARAGVRAATGRRRHRGDAERGPRRDRHPGPRGSPGRCPPAPLSAAPVHAGLPGRGRRRDHVPPGPGRLDRGQVRRHPRPAPPAGPGGPALQPRSPRRERPVPGGGRLRGAPRLGWDPRRRAARLSRRCRAAVPGPPATARPQGTVRGAAGRGPRRLRRVRRAGAGTAGTAT